LISGATFGPAADSTLLEKPAHPTIPGGYFFRKSAQYSRYREQISYLYTRGFGLFRTAYLHIGRSFANAGWLENAEDIFYLEHEEIFSVIRQESAGTALGNLIGKRITEHRRNLSITLPPVIYGDHLPPVQDDLTPLLVGVPVSGGIYRGVVRVVKGLGEFHKVTDGCVLVIPFSDVSWTPLFSRAGALIAEAGGVLSHSAIVAREYGIPAIVSLPNATRLQDGVEVTVNGYSGNVLVHDEKEVNDAE